MYNRYISQPDGSFEKKQITEAEDISAKQISSPGKESANTPPINHLMPFDLDNRDMLIFIMLMLINGSSENEYNTLLTLVFYLFL